MSPRVVVVHPELGIYLGSFLGLGFFSRLDGVGQDMAVTFEDATEARAFVASWDSNNDPDAFDYVEVEADRDRYASVPALTAAGLEPMLGALAKTESEVEER